LSEKIINHENINNYYETTNDQLNKSIMEKNTEIDKLKKDLATFETETEINIKNSHKEKDTHILEKQSLDKNLKELETK